MSDRRSTPAEGTSAPETCAYCGLPIPKTVWLRRASAENAGEAYCCLGCSFAATITESHGNEGAARWLMVRLAAGAFFSMNVMVFTLALWTGDVYGDAAVGPMAASWQGIFRYLAMFFSLPVVFFLGVPLATEAIAALRRGWLTTDVLAIAGVAAAFVYSVSSTLRETGHVYYEVACMVLVFVTLGRWFEAKGKLAAAATLDDLEALLPSRITASRDGQSCELALDEIREGDVVTAATGDRFAADGVLLAGHVAVDEQLLTGESRTIEKYSGDPILAGTLIMHGTATYRVSQRSSSSALARLVECVRAAREQKGPYQRLADRLTAAFVPVVMIIAGLAGTYHGMQAGLDVGLLAALAVVLIACPCSIGLATPLAVWTAVATAANARVLFRDGDALERFALVRAIRFDKTGTLTAGTHTLVDCVGLTQSPSALDADASDRALRRAAAVVRSSYHPLGRAIVRAANTLHPLPVATSVDVSPGQGVSAVLCDTGQRVFVGSREFMNAKGMAWPLGRRPVSRASEPETCVAWNGTVQAVLRFSETIRPEAAVAIQDCVAGGIDVAVLTGDRSERAAGIETELGIAVLARQLPEDKVTAIREVQRRVGPVAMVGDGVNDAPALAAADVGIAMGCGADVTRESADICLLGDDLRRVPWTLALARNTRRIIRRNVIWGFAYNSLGIVLAAGGWLNPIVAAVLMAVSSGFVVTNSLSLRDQPAEMTDRSTPKGASVSSVQHPQHVAPAATASEVVA